MLEVAGGCPSASLWAISRREHQRQVFRGEASQERWTEQQIHSDTWLGGCLRKRKLDWRIGTKRSAGKRWTWASQVGKENADISILHEHLSEGIHCWGNSYESVDEKECCVDGRHPGACSVGPCTRGHGRRDGGHVWSQHHGVPSSVPAWLCRVGHPTCHNHSKLWIWHHSRGNQSSIS